MCAEPRTCWPATSATAGFGPSSPAIAMPGSASVFSCRCAGPPGGRGAATSRSHAAWAPVRESERREKTPGSDHRLRGRALCREASRLAPPAGHRPVDSRRLTRVQVAPGVWVRVPTDPPVSPDVPASRFVSPSGSDTASCGASDPCRSFNRAYEAALPGQVVDVAGGVYPASGSNTIPRRPRPRTSISARQRTISSGWRGTSTSTALT